LERVTGIEPAGTSLEDWRRTITTPPASVGWVGPTCPRIVIPAPDRGKRVPPSVLGRARTCTSHFSGGVSTRLILQGHVKRTLTRLAPGSNLCHRWPTKGGHRISGNVLASARQDSNLRYSPIRTERAGLLPHAQLMGVDSTPPCTSRTAIGTTPQVWTAGFEPAVLLNPNQAG
jgi:hypothetical protein